MKDNTIRIIMISLLVTSFSAAWIYGRSQEKCVCEKLLPVLDNDNPCLTIIFNEKHQKICLGEKK